MTRPSRFLALLWCLFYQLNIASLVNSSQIPLLHQTAKFSSISSWQFNFSSPSPHYFSSVHNLLKQWPQTYFPNGHALAAASIPAFTKVYHGRQGPDPPPSPEWLAFDIGMSYGIMGSTRDSFMLTYSTTRPVNVLYFDGESATLMGEGRMDSQMLTLFGNVSGPAHGPAPDGSDGHRGLWQEYLRANGLCDWLLEKKLRGPGWGIEGIVRMNAGFELIWCDFDSPSLRLISWLNVSAPLQGNTQANGGGTTFGTFEKERRSTNSKTNRDSRIDSTSYYPLPPSPTRLPHATDTSVPAVPPNWRHSEREPFLKSQGWEWFRSAVKHYGGEGKVKIYQCGILNYYSPEYHNQALARARHEQRFLNLTQSGLWTGSGEDGKRNQALTQLLRRRRTHRLDETSKIEADIMRETAESLLRDIVSGVLTCSGTDWGNTINEIVETYASSLLALRNHLGVSDDVARDNSTEMRIWIAGIRDANRELLVPFLEYPEGTGDPGIWSKDGQLFADTFARCHFYHTRLLENATLTLSEDKLKTVVEDVMSSIGSTTIEIGFMIESIWFTSFNQTPLLPKQLSTWTASNDEQMSRSLRGIEELMAYLGWADQWTKCDKVCEWNEECYIPMWPMTHRDGQIRPPPRRPDNPHHPPGGGRGDHDRGRNGDFWHQDETDLWKPKCIKRDYIMG